MRPAPLPTSLTRPQRDALARAGIENGDDLVRWVATQLADLMRAQNQRLRPTPTNAAQWLADLVGRTEQTPVEHIDPIVLDGWETEASFTIYFLRRDDPGGGSAQILAMRNEHEDQEKTWTTWDCSPVGPWMTGQLGGQPALEPEEPAPGPAPAPAPGSPGSTCSDHRSSPDNRDRRPPMTPAKTPTKTPAETPAYRTYDGTSNGGRNLGRTGTPLLDLDLPPTPFDPDRLPNPRVVSTRICRSDVVTCDPYNRSDFMWAWGQFLDHELDLIDEGGDIVPVRVPEDDPRIEFRDTQMTFSRSARDRAGGLPNLHTAYVDASNVYGTTAEQAEELRTLQDGYLKTSEGRNGEPLLPVEGSQFVAGDRRANENCVLIGLHTIWVREHNRLCDVLAAGHGITDDEELYQMARKLVGAQMQVITYEEFVPALLGPDALAPWSGFRRDIDPGVSSLFATAAYRLGHAMVPSHLDLGPDGDPLPLRDAFFAPGLVLNAGIEPFLRSLAHRPMGQIDTIITEGLREHLFPNEHGLELRDLATLNIQRGRDHELPSYDRVRHRFGLSPISSFNQLTDDADLAADLTGLYGHPDHCDIWVAALTEQPQGHRRVGDLLWAILADQFTRLRDGDYYWWENDPHLQPSFRSWVAKRRLTDVLRENTDFERPHEVFPDDVFWVGPTG